MPTIQTPFSGHKSGMVRISVTDADNTEVESWEIPTGTPTLNIPDAHFNGNYTITAQLLTSGGKIDPTVKADVLRARTNHVKQVPATSGQEPASGTPASAHSPGAGTNGPQSVEPASPHSEASEPKAEPVGHPAGDEIQPVTTPAEPVVAHEPKPFVPPRNMRPAMPRPPAKPASKPASKPPTP